MSKVVLRRRVKNINSKITIIIGLDNKNNKNNKINT